MDTPEANLCCYNRPGWYGKNKRQEFHHLMLLDDISITSGTVSDGQTLPIPEGFLENECVWLLSMNQSNVNRIYYDINEGGAYNMINHECWREGRKVHVGTRLKGLDGISPQIKDPYTKFGWNQEYWVSGTANYVCIAIKRA